MVRLARFGYRRFSNRFRCLPRFERRGLLVVYVRRRVKPGSRRGQFHEHQLRYTFSIFKFNGRRDDYDQFFNHHTTLAKAEAQKFPNQTWTHVTIKKMGDTLTDNVGGQTITADLSGANFPPTVHIGLGYYATKNVGGNGQFTYSNIRVVQANQR